MVAPGAQLDDGLLDLTIWKGYSLVDFVLLQKRLQDGRHVELAKTRVLRGREVEIEPLGGARVLLEVDGEQPGVLPARLTAACRGR